MERPATRTNSAAITEESRSTRGSRSGTPSASRTTLISRRRTAGSSFGPARQIEPARVGEGPLCGCGKLLCYLRKREIHWPFPTPNGRRSHAGLRLLPQPPSRLGRSASDPPWRRRTARPAPASSRARCPSTCISVSATSWSHWVTATRATLAKVLDCRISPSLGRDTAIGQEPGGAYLDQRLVPTRAECRREGVPFSFECPGQQREQPVTPGVAGDAHTLIGQRAANHRGPSADTAEDFVGRGPDVVEEALVQVMWPEHGGDGTHFDALPVHRNQEDGDAPASVIVGFGHPGRPKSNTPPSPHTRSRSSGPKCATIAVHDGVGRQGEQVRSGVGLAETLTPDAFAGGDRREVERLLLLRPEFHDRRDRPN